MARVLEPEVMETEAEAAAYDELERRFGEILFQGFAESALHMGVTKGRVLDVGCGPGRIAIRLAALNPDFAIDGIDLSRSMLNLATRNAEQRGVAQQIRFSIGDAKKIPFPDATFDMAVCHNMLHQLPDPVVVVKEIARVVKPGGALLIRDVRRLPEPLMTLVLPLYCVGYSSMLRQLTYSSYRAGLTYRELAEVVRAAGITGGSITRQFLTHHSLERPAAPYRWPVRSVPVGSVLFRLLRWPYARRRRP